MECKPRDDDVYCEHIIGHSTHRDGAIYKNEFIWQEFLEFDIADRNETQLEPMKYSKATKWCWPNAKNCMYHIQQHMLQFFSVVLSKSPINPGSMQLYGYIAARDEEDGMLKYIVNYGRDDLIVMQQGSLIEMTGPKRGILLDGYVLIEFDMRIKNGMQEEDDYEEIQLFNGNIVQTGALRRFVVAARWSARLLLNFREGNDGGGWHSQQIIKFQAKKHGCASQQIKLKAAAISVKVTWSSVSRSVVIEDDK